MSEPYYIAKLQNEFIERKSRNASYSLRSFATYLNLHSSTLSSILKKKRPFPVNRIEWAIQRLQLDEEETNKFYQSVIQERFLIIPPALETKHNLLNEELHFNILSQWEYYGVLTLFDLKEFKPTFQYISKKLGIPLSRVKSVWQGLEQAGLIIKDPETGWKKSSSHFSTSDDITSKALQISHIEELEIARQKLLKVPVLRRDYTSTMVAIPKKNILKAKKLIRQFHRDFSQLVESPQADRVYLLAVQFLPLTDEED